MVKQMKLLVINSETERFVVREEAGAYQVGDTYDSNQLVESEIILPEHIDESWDRDALNGLMMLRDVEGLLLHLIDLAYGQGRRDQMAISSCFSAGDRTYEILNLPQRSDEGVIRGDELIRRIHELGAVLGEDDARYIHEHEEEIPPILRGEGFVFIGWPMDVPGYYHRLYNENGWWRIRGAEILKTCYVNWSRVKYRVLRRVE